MSDTKQRQRPGMRLVGLAVAVWSGFSCSFLVETLDCTSNADCLAKSDFTICRRDPGATIGQCTQLLSPACDIVYGDWKNDDALLFGSVLPSKGDDLATGKACENAIYLATEDFRLMANNLPAVPGQDSKRRRPLAFVACSDDDSKEQGVKAAQHLVDDLHVPVVLGAQWSGITTEIATRVTIPGKALLISPSATAVSIGALADEGLVWRTSPSDTYQGDAIVAYLKVLEAKVRQARNLTADQKIKVATVYHGGTYGIGLGTRVESRLFINGARATGSTNQQNYMSYNYGDPNDGTPLRTAEAVSKLLAFKPDIVLDLCTKEGITDILVPVERDWSLSNASVPRPLWVLGDGGESSTLWDSVGSNDDLRKRVSGTVPGTQNTLFDDFKRKYRAFGFDTVTDPAALGPAGSYDSVYLLAYAAVSLGSTPVTGPNLATALPSIGPPTGTSEVKVGANEVNTTLTTMLTGGKINFRGASGPLDFDWATGEAPSDIQIWCMPRTDDGKAGSGVNSGLFLDASLYIGTDPPASLSGAFDPGTCDLN